MTFRTNIRHYFFTPNFSWEWKTISTNFISWKMSQKCFWVRWNEKKKQFFINLFIEVGVPSLSLPLPTLLLPPILHVNHFLLRNKIIIYDIIHGSKSMCEWVRERMRVRVCIENGKKRECVLVSLRERVREREWEERCMLRSQEKVWWRKMIVRY